MGGKMRNNTKKMFTVLMVISSVLFSLNHSLLIADEIHDSAREGDLKKVRAILRDNPDLLNARSDNGATPLHVACWYGKTEVATYLIQKGADINLKAQNNISPLHIAAMTGNLELVKLLLEKGSTSLLEGAEWNNTPLHLACERGHPAVVEYLLDEGANMEARNELKRTPLIAAAREKGDLRVIKILVERGADIHARDISNDTPLTLAAWRGFEDVVNYMIEKKSQIPEDKKWPVLWMAVENNLKVLYNYMLENGLSPDAVKDTHPTLIHSAATGGSIDIVSSLIRKGFDPDFQDKDGWSPLHYAASQGKNEMIDFLINSGVDKNSRNKKGETAYHLAVFREFPESAEKLEKLGVDSTAPRFPELRGQYMGQIPPGDKPEIFLPGIVSGHYHHHSTIVFSPDGKEACWTEMYPPREKGYGTSGVMTMRMVNGIWSYPEKSKVMRGEPFFSPDEKRLYFISRKSPPGKKEEGKENIWYMTRNLAGWSEPVSLDPVVNAMQMHWQFSLDKQGNLYFADWNCIYYAENDKGKFNKPVDFSELTNNPTLKGYCPFISPDGDYLIFSCDNQENNRSIDLFVSFRKKDDAWTDRINLGESINGTERNIGAFVSADGKYLFFTSAGENRPWGTYWVDAKIIEQLKPKELR